MIPQSINSFYADPNLSRYLSKQLKQINAQSIIIQKNHVIASVKLPPKSQIYHYNTDDNQNIQFIFVIGKSFPANPPSIHIKDALTAIGFNDCRNLVYEILKQEWNYKVGLKGIVQKLPQFLMRINKNDDILYFSELGYFHLNHYYPITLLKILHPTRCFVCFEAYYDKIKMLLFIVTNTHVLIFLTNQQPKQDSKTFKHTIPHQNQITLCKLIFYAETGCMTQINCSKSNKFTQIQIVFQGKKTYNMQRTEKISRWKIRCRKGGLLIQKLIKSIKNYQPEEIRLDLDPDGVTQEEAAILLQTSLKQKQIINRFNKNTIRQLNLSYQLTVQYYSSKNIPYFEVFVDKISRLNLRGDVRLVMEADSPLKAHSKATLHKLKDQIFDFDLYKESQTEDMEKITNNLQQKKIDAKQLE